MKTFKQFVSEVSEQTQQSKVKISPELKQRIIKGNPDPNDPYWYKIPGLGVKEQVTCTGTNCGEGPKVDRYGRPLPGPPDPNYNTPVIRTTPGPKPPEGLTPDPTLKRWDAKPYTWAKKKIDTKTA